MTVEDKVYSFVSVTVILLVLFHAQTTSGINLI